MIVNELTMTHQFTIAPHGLDDSIRQTFKTLNDSCLSKSMYCHAFAAS